MSKRVPEWAEAWLPSHCPCGARAVEVVAVDCSRRVVCSVSGWEVEICQLKSGT